MAEHSIKFTVYGNAVAKKAPKMFLNPKTKRPMAFKDKSTRDWENAIRTVAQDHVPKNLLDGPLYAKVTFHILRPKSKPKKVLYPDTKPDLDNLEKSLFDALEGLIFVNDSRIVEKHIEKVYGDPPRVDIEVGEKAKPLEKIEKIQKRLDELIREG